MKRMGTEHARTQAAVCLAVAGIVACRVRNELGLLRVQPLFDSARSLNKLKERDNASNRASCHQGRTRPNTTGPTAQAPIFRGPNSCTLYWAMAC